MKTFQEFILECELVEGRSLSAILNPGSVADYSSQNNRNLSSIVRDQKRAESSMSANTNIQNSSYLGRLRAGVSRNKPKESNNPNYQGNLGFGGAGTKDRMPGTTPSSSPSAPPLYIKKFNKGSNQAPANPALKGTPIPLSSNRYKNYI